VHDPFGPDPAEAETELTKAAMRRFAFLLLLLTAPAWAGWTAVSQDSAGATYADPDTIVHTGDTARMWWLLDYSAFQRMVEVGYYSQRTHAEYDCAQPRSRVLNLSLRAEHMGEGKAIYSDESPHEWEPVEPGTTAEKLRAIACRR
jgi:hypothetical protein